MILHLLALMPADRLVTDLAAVQKFDNGCEELGFIRLAAGTVSTGGAMKWSSFRER